MIEPGPLTRAILTAEQERVNDERRVALVAYATKRVNAYLGRKVSVDPEVRLVVMPSGSVNLALIVQVVERRFELRAAITPEMAAEMPAWTDIGTALVDQIIRRMREAGIPGDLDAGMR